MKNRVIVNVGSFAGSNDNPAIADKSGKFPVILNPVSGAVPFNRVLSGTIAHSLGLEVGKTYLMSYVDGGIQDVPGKGGVGTVQRNQYTWTNAGEVKAIELLSLGDTLDAGTILPEPAQQLASVAPIASRRQAPVVQP